MSEPKTSIPRFASFQPKSAPPVVQNQVEKVEKERVKSHHRDRNDDNESPHEHRRSRKPRSKERRRDLSKDRHLSSRYRDVVEISQEPPPPNDGSDVIFVIDRKGDLKNLVYGSIHRYSVPSYYRYGAGSVLGIPSYMRIDRDHRDEKGIILNDRRVFKSRHREKYIFSKIGNERPRLLKIRPDIVVQDSIEEDYVSFKTARRKKRKRVSEESSDSENGDTNYRSIHGKANPRDEPEDENLQYVTGSESSDSEDGHMIEKGADDVGVKQKTLELSRKVEQYPHDVTAWLALIEHQDIVLGGSQRRVTNAELTSRADIKIHMFEQALGNAQSLRDRETLLLGLMAEGGKIWEIKTQSERWEQISKDNIDSLMLWKSYLNFRQTAFGTLQYEEIRDMFLQRIKLLLQAINENSDHALYGQIIYVLVRLTTFIRESGYAELAVAIWQGILESAFFAPPKSLDAGRSVELFKDFWESEVPRIGEDAALGWRHFVENEGISEVPDAINDDEGNKLDHRHIFKSWALAEQKRAQVSRMPARTMDDVVEDDPFRVILASDIGDFLIPFPMESDEIRASLLDAFLLFCRLPPLNSITKAQTGWTSDPFVAESLLECDSTWIKAKYAREDADTAGERQADISSIFTIRLSNFKRSPESMFSKSWFKDMQTWREVYCGDNGPLRFNYIRNTLKQLVQVYLREDLAEYYLSFEWRNEPESIKKVCKSLLKQQPTSLRLYNAYAMIEWSRENRVLAKAVYSAALDMAKSMPETDRDGSILLWKSWLWAYLESKDKKAAISLLLSIESGIPSDDLTSSPFLLLKTKQHLSQRRDYHLYSGSVPYSILYAECLALLEYLTATPSHNETQSRTQGNITAALEAYSKFSHTLQQTFKERSISDTSSHELFLQSAARLVYHHASTGPFRPALLREHLSNYITLFPQNTIFLSLYTFNEARLRVDNRVRNIFSSTILTSAHDTLTSRLFAIYFEIAHGTIHSVRSSFEHALNSPSKHSPGFWRFYLLYSLHVPQFRKHSKSIWYRALRACPWAKELYITGFKELEIVDREELMGTWKVMGEKGLRVHVDLEDALDMEK
ncbi:nrde2 [Hyphodiscus hymeniophilus]|uniref:Nrde2 n=1 Tax=Hyphodiscus hymeniophilus TaxID=353542 RepID=A0A9P6VFA6_9HELO|nr:nrde2 [Hyphodiscus hymeniophilus]